MAPVTVGEGDRKVLCLHGWFGSATGWGDWPDLVDGSAFTYAFLDYRGYGDRKDVAGEFTMDEIAADGIALADELGWGDFAVLGHSMGGKAAARVLCKAPDRVTRLVGVSPVPAMGVPFDEQTWGLFDGAAQNDGNRAAIIAFSTGDRLSNHWIEQMVAHSVEHSTREAFAAYLTAWAKGDFAADLAGIDVPVKVIVGEHDPAISAAVVEQTWLKQFPSAELDIQTNAGHYAMYETPVASLTVVEEFLSR